MTAAGDSVLPVTYTAAEIYWHEPYRDRECDACHDPADRGIRSETAICFSCHANETGKYPFGHGPFSGGYCTACHNPHKSARRHLLVGQGDELCLRCHLASDLSADVFHGLAGAECRDCHGSHGSNNFSILRAESCTLCHGDLGDSFAFLHGPVDAGLCSACHVSHYRGGEKHLLREGDGLCLSCHEPEEWIAVELHSDLEGFTCTECHNPHGGEDRLLLE